MLLLWTASGVWCSSVKPALSDNLEKVQMYALQIMLWKLLQDLPKFPTSLSLKLKALFVFYTYPHNFYCINGESSPR